MDSEQPTKRETEYLEQSRFAPGSLLWSDTRAGAIAACERGPSEGARSGSKGASGACSTLFYSLTVTFMRMGSSGLSRSSRGSFAIMSMTSIPRKISPKME